MRITYKGCTYRIENLTPDLKKLMSKEIAKAELKEKNLANIKKAISEVKAKKGK